MHIIFIALILRSLSSHAEPVKLLDIVKPVHLIWVGSSFQDNDIKYTYVNALCDKMKADTRAIAKRIILWSDARLLTGPVADSTRFLCESVSLELKDVQELLRPTSARFEKIAREMETNYEYLLSMREKLENRIFSPMVDIVKLLAVYQQGGIYFDIKKDFSSLSFNTVDVTLPEIFDNNRFIVGTPVSLYVGHKYAKDIYATFFARNLMTDEPYVVSSAAGTFFRAFPQYFFNMDYFGALNPESSALKRAIDDIAHHYQLLKTKPILQVFLNTGGFHSQSWIFLTGGPVAFTQAINQSPHELANIDQKAIYKGSQSWGAQPDSSFPLWLMSTCLGEMDSPHNPLFKSMTEQCWQLSHMKHIENAGAENYVVVAEDLEFCLFNTLMTTLKADVLDSQTDEKLTTFARDFFKISETLEKNLSNTCLEKFGLAQSDPQALQVSFRLTNSFKSIDCALDGPEPQTILVDISSLNKQQLCYLRGQTGEKNFNN